MMLRVPALKLLLAASQSSLASKAGKKKAAAGTYKLTLSAVGTDGQKASTTVSLKLKR